MGAYINPPDSSKEVWLGRNAIVLDGPPERFDEREGEFPIVLIDNGYFTAAGIAFDQRELELFLFPDPRPKIWLSAPIEKLHDVSPALKDYMERSARESAG